MNKEVNRSQRVMTNGQPETPDHREINPDTGQQKGYIVLTEEERSKGYIRPVRYSYVHVGDFKDFHNHESGHEWKQRYGGCGAITKMSQPIAETYARDPGFYDGTFCIGCKTHFPLVEFVWEGTEEQVGS